MRAMPHQMDVGAHCGDGLLASINIDAEVTTILLDRFRDNIDHLSSLTHVCRRLDSEQDEEEGVIRYDTVTMHELAS